MKDENNSKVQHNFDTAWWACPLRHGRWKVVSVVPAGEQRPQRCLDCGADCVLIDGTVAGDQ